MIVVGLTGSIGMGKTTVATMCRRLGIPVDNADDVVHRLLAPNGAAFAAVAAKFPQAVRNGQIDRVMLGAIVFADSGQLATLEGIIHPLVARARQAFLARCERQKRRLVVLDIPLLFEKKLEDQVDVIVTVSAPAFIQRARVLARPGMTPQKFENILARQMPDAEKRRRSTYVIPTGRVRAITLKYLRRILKRIDS
jgi:dephospho-CoA kinase